MGQRKDMRGWKIEE
jgi:hypothetical protein